MKKRILSILSVILLCVVLFSLFPTASFAEDTAEENTDRSPFYNIECNYDSQSGKIKIEYRMNSTAVKKYEKLSVSIYRLSVGESIDTFDFSKAEPKIKDITPSNRTVTDFASESLIDRISGYFLAIKTRIGEYITSEVFYPSVKGYAINTGFKGIASTDSDTVLYTNVETVMLEIDGERLESGRSGYLFKSDGKTYTFSREYVDGIDSLIKIYSSAGVDIILKIIPRKNETSAYAYQSLVYAYVSFFVARYSDLESSISGIALGDVDTTDGGGSPELYSSCLYAAASAINSHGNAIGLIVPVSDSYAAATDFLEKLCDEPALSSGASFTVMVEGSANPYCLTDDASVEALQKNSKDVIATDNYSIFKTFLYDLAEKKGNVYIDSIYNFIPNPSYNEITLKAAYLYGYLSMFFGGKVDSYIVSAGGADDSLVESIRYINTESAEKKVGLDSLKRIFGIKDLAKEFKKYTSLKLVTSKLKEIEASKTLKDTVKGSSPYFEFSSSADIADWYPSESCGGISTGKNTFGKALVARFSDSCFVIHKYKYTESFKYTDYIEFELMLESDSKQYTVSIDIGGEGFLYTYSSPKLVSGVKERMYIDVSEFTENNKIEYIALKISTGDRDSNEDKLYLYSLNAKSKTYDSETLTELIEAERERLKDSAENVSGTGANIKAVIVIAAAVLLTVIAMIMISKKQKQNQQMSEDTK